MPATSPPPPTKSYTIIKVRTQQDLSAIKTLFTLYTNSLAIDLTFQNLETELTTLPGKYSPPHRGELLLARSSTSEAIGCIALRALSPKTAELKRLYVTPAARGTGLARALTRDMLDIATELGYNEVKLDTLPDMRAAQAIYAGFGFVDIEPYCFNPIEGTRFMGCRLPLRTVTGTETGTETETR